MAERVITVELDVDTSGVVKGLNEMDSELESVKTQLESVEDDIRNVSKASAQSKAAENFEKLNKIVEKNALSLQELGTAADNYKNIALVAGKESPIGQEALKKAAELEKQLDLTNQSVAKLAEGGRNLNAAMELGTGVIAGYTAFTGITELLGTENEKLQETFVKLQAAQATLAGVKELSIALDKEGLLITSAQAAATKVLTGTTIAYNAVVGTSTGLMKAFKIALAATGIGAIVIGLGLLIANFDEVVGWVKKAINWFSNFGEILTRVGEFFGFVEEGSADLMEQERKAAEERKKQQKELMDQHKERLKVIDDEKKKRINASNAKIRALELEKDTLEAQGKSSYKVTLEMLNQEKLKLEAVLDANRKKIQSWIDYYTNLAELRGQDREEFFKSMKQQGVDLETMQKKANLIIAEGERKVKFAENRITKFKREHNEKRLADKKKSNEKILEEEKRLNDAILIEAEEANKLYLEQEELLTQLLLNNMEDGAEKELAMLQDKHDKERDAIIAKYGEDTELLKQLEIKQAKELEPILDELNQKRVEKELEVQESLNNLNEENWQENLAKAEEALGQIQGYLDTASQINDILNELNDRQLEKNQENRDKELASIEKQKKQELKQEGLSAREKALIEHKFAIQEYNTKKKSAEAEDEINKKKFKRDKALRLAQIGIDTAAAIVKAIAMFGPPPSPLGIAGIAAAGAIGIAQGAIVATQKFKGSAGAIQPPSFDFVAPSADAGGGSSSGGGANNGSTVAGSQNNITTETEGLINGGGVGTTQVVLSMVEVNEAQNEMQMIDDVSTL